MRALYTLLFVATSIFPLADSIQCGLAPREIMLNRGGRQKLVFWTDQNYVANEEVETETTTKDYFLEAVNGGGIKPDVGGQDDDKISPQDEAFLAQEELDLQVLGEEIEGIVTTTEDSSDVEVTTVLDVNEEFTTNPPMPDDEIFDDDADEEVFHEDFGTPIVSSQPDAIYDPLDDIADISDTNTEVTQPEDVELLETAEITTVSLYGNNQQRLFDQTTIAFPIEDKTTTPQPPIVLPIFEAVVAEEAESDRDENGDFVETTTSNDLKNEIKPVFEAVVAEEEEEENSRPLVDSQGNFIETTTPSEKPLSSSGETVKIEESFEIEAVVAEEEEEQDERPTSLLDADGNFIQTTTGSPKDTFKLEASVAEEDQQGNLIETTTGTALNKVAKVALEKLSRGADSDLIEDNDLQSIQVSTTESPQDLVQNITDPRPILTTLIDGFLLQKQPPVEPEVDKTASILSLNLDKEETAGGFPVTNILSGIYSLVSSYIQPTDEVEVDEVVPITAIPQSAINVHNMPRDQLIVEAIEDFQAPPLPILPPEYLRARPIDIQPKPTKPKPESLSGPVLVLTENAKGGKPVSIPVVDTDNVVATPEAVIDPRAFDPVESLRSSDKTNLKEFIASQPEEVRQFFIFRKKRDVETEEDSEEPELTTFTPHVEDEQVDHVNNVNCTWTVKTEPGLYLLATFHNLSAPHTVECEGAYIEVERENNGFEARWCGNRVTTGGSRPHVIFAKNQVRITVFDDGSQNKDLPTGFSADIEVIDLYDGQKSEEELKSFNGYSNVRKLSGRTAL